MDDMEFLQWNLWNLLWNNGMWDFVGEYKIILQLIGLMSHGKQAKRLADASIDRMDGVQNLRRAVFECVLFLFLFGLDKLTDD